MARTKILKKKARALTEKNLLIPALQIYEDICKIDSGDAEAWFMLGGIHGRLGQFEQAAECCRKSLAIDPQNASAHINLGSALQGLHKYGDAMDCYQQALRIQPALPEAHYNMGNLFRDQGSFDAAEQSYDKAVQLKPDHALAHYHRGSMMKLQCRVDEAVASYDRALQYNGNLAEAYWNKLRILPVIYDNEDQIAFHREKYAKGLNALCNQLSLDTPKARQAALRGISASTNFYLQYQGRNDIDLQCQFGELAHKIMAANYPQWSAAVKMPRLEPGGKIRIGYASAFLRAHNGALWLLGWLRHRDPDGFEVYCYYTGTEIDDKTREFMRHSDHFHHVPGDLEKACAQIATDKLHLLVYPELGMDMPTMLMAGLRLAPVQCVGWGHPITSGLPAMDYWISSDLMEPENAQEHYSEKLVRLPNMGHCYAKSQHDKMQSQSPSKNRSDFKLRDDAVLYLCSQSLFKYLPQYDYLFPAIAKQVPKAQFVFLAISSVYVVRRFMERIDRAFQSAGLRAEDYCEMSNRLPPDDYLVLNQLADVFLDNPPWSGNNTTLAAIDCHLPVVSLPTKFMRGRHSYAILKMLGVTETIASNDREYIDIAARLGNDEEWRREIAQKICDRHARIYEDTSCVRGLEQFYREAVEKQMTGHRERFP